MARRVRAWDLAASANPAADFTAGVKLAAAESRYVIEDLIHGRWTPHDRDTIIRQTADIDGRAVAIVIEQEPGAAGVSQIAAMVRLLAGFTVSGRRPTGEKLVRAGPLASQMEAGNVILVSGSWNAALIDELTSFPSEGIHDDIVDACSLAFNYLTESLPTVAGIVSTRRVSGGWGGRKGRIF